MLLLAGKLAPRETMAHVPRKQGPRALLASDVDLQNWQHHFCGFKPQVNGILLQQSQNANH